MVRNIQKVEKHWLTPESIEERIVKSETPNVRDEIDPDYLIIHYTAGDTARSAIDWFMNTKDNPNKIAAHIVLDLDGTITQLVPFNRRANHAGSSTWDGVENFNHHSIGIEVVNPGYCEKLENNTFRRKVTASKNQTYGAERVADILETKHKHRFWTAKDNNWWFKFSQKQLEALYKLGNILTKLLPAISLFSFEPISFS